ncbi:DUF1993 family protein [Halomonas maura]|uniref:DUF1993 family protein n=1 Tax=Halomonas maura TaxID=117606 RepID=UPI0025B36D88|nr:DUF1993 family protein [Halomonas maura]MDN3556830.1 DUF1993 family protein [Halomonas maura]
MSIKEIFKHYLYQLEVIVSRIPPENFSLALSEGMFSLEMNAKIAANFVLRGYCPLLHQDVVSFISDEPGKAAVKKQIADTLAYLSDLPEVMRLNDKELVKDTAGFIEVEFSQPLFIHQYILPNFIFHISMVYAIAKANGVELSKGDFDGIHSYPNGFSFISSP